MAQNGVGAQNNGVGALVPQREDVVANNAPIIRAPDEAVPAANAEPGILDIINNAAENLTKVDTDLFQNKKPQKPEKGTEVPEWKDAVIAALKALETSGKIRSVDALNKAVIKYGGVISGGFILKAAKGGFVDNWARDVPDIDIYIPVKNIPAFLNDLLMSPTKILKEKVSTFISHEAAFYCKSFLRKNGIRKVYQFNSGRDNRQFRFDVMAVRNKRTPLNVVTNFDLTCCQVWYDGETVYATHPDHIRESKAVLQGEYVKTFYEGNKFLVERIQKYRRRGFTVTYDTEAPLPSIEEVIAAHSYGAHCGNGEHAVTRRRDDDFLNRWSRRIFKKWFIGHKNATDDSGAPILAIPFSRAADQGLDNTPVTDHRSQHGQQFARFRIRDDDGYDTEDFDDESMKKISIERYSAINPPGDELVTPPIDEELTTNRLKTMLLVEAMKSSSGQHNGDRGFHINFGKMHRMAEQAVRGESDVSFYRYKWKAVETYINALRERCGRQGSDIFGDDGLMYDLHKHPLEGCISRDSLEGYLEGHIKDTDKEEGIPCYWQPNADKAHPSNCKQKLTLDEIRALVSLDFWVRFTAPAPVKSGLNQVIGAYDAVLEDEKTANTLGFGDIHGATMCPFCLQFEGRDSGCAYMGHDNPKGRPSDDHPYCLPQFAVPEMLQKYKDTGARLDPGWAGHLEFCVECGRPCYGHRHFKLDGSGFEADRVIPDPARPGRTKIDYGSCTGGGRAELFARILAVREVYRKRGVRKPGEERKEAAELADTVMTARPDIVARARAIAAKPPAERKWNDKIQSKKQYDDPAYADEPEVGDDEYDGEGPPNRPPPPPGAPPLPPPPNAPGGPLAAAAAAAEEEGVVVGPEEPAAAPAQAAAAPAAPRPNFEPEFLEYIRPLLQEDLDEYEDQAHFAEDHAFGVQMEQAAGVIRELLNDLDNQNRMPTRERLTVMSNMLDRAVQTALNAGNDNNLMQYIRWKEHIDGLLNPPAAAVPAAAVPAAAVPAAAVPAAAAPAPAAAAQGGGRRVTRRNRGRGRTRSNK